MNWNEREQSSTDSLPALRVRLGHCYIHNVLWLCQAENTKRSGLSAVLKSIVCLSLTYFFKIAYSIYNVLEKPWTMPFIFGKYLFVVSHGSFCFMKFQWKITVFYKLTQSAWFEVCGSFSALRVHNTFSPIMSQSISGAHLVLNTLSVIDSDFQACLPSLVLPLQFI